LGVLWFDGEWEKPWTTERGQELYRHVRALQPNIIVNNRVSPGRQGLDGTTAAGFFRGDFDTPEQQIGQFQTAHPWESCITICEQWAWKPNDKLKSLKQCLQTLISCAGGDGNLLLNVGPMPTGEIEPRQVERLHQIGQWLRKHGRSIYCTRGGPFKPGKWGASTHRGRTVYVHVFEWPAEGLNLPPLDQRVVKARVRTGGKVDVQQTSAGLSLRLVKGQPDPLDTLIELSLSAPVTVRP
jgi:alpha-L-fucosidase